jgi:hypothetical protein
MGPSVSYENIAFSLEIRPDIYLPTTLFWSILGFFLVDMVLKVPLAYLKVLEYPILKSLFCCCSSDKGTEDDFQNAKKDQNKKKTLIK